MIVITVRLCYRSFSSKEGIHDCFHRTIEKSVTRQDNHGDYVLFSVKSIFLNECFLTAKKYLILPRMFRDIPEKSIFYIINSVI